MNLIISYHIIIVYDTFGNVSFQMQSLCFVLKALSTGWQTAGMLNTNFYWSFSKLASSNEVHVIVTIKVT